MRKRLFAATGVGAVIACGALAFTIAATAGDRTPDPSCYPTNEFQIAGGSTKAFLNAKMNAEFALEPTYGGAETLMNGKVNAKMSFKVAGGQSLKGYASVDFTIKNTGTRGHFESTCIQEAATDLNGPEDTGNATNNFEAEFEGQVTGLPWSPGKQNAVATLSGFTQNGVVIYHFNVEQGTTCNEYTGEFGSTNEDRPPNDPNGTLNAENTDSARWGIPAPFDASASTPCTDVSS